MIFPGKPAEQHGNQPSSDEPKVEPSLPKRPEDELRELLAFRKERATGVHRSVHGVPVSVNPQAEAPSAPKSPETVAPKNIFQRIREFFSGNLERSEYDALMELIGELEQGSANAVPEDIIQIQKALTRIAVQIEKAPNEVISYVRSILTAYQYLKSVEQLSGHEVSKKRKGLSEITVLLISLASEIQPLLQGRELQQVMQLILWGKIVGRPRIVRQKNMTPLKMLSGPQSWYDYEQQPLPDWDKVLFSEASSFLTQLQCGAEAVQLQTLKEGTSLSDPVTNYVRNTVPIAFIQNVLYESTTGRAERCIDAMENYNIPDKTEALCLTEAPVAPREREYSILLRKGNLIKKFFIPAESLHPDGVTLFYEKFMQAAAEDTDGWIDLTDKKNAKIASQIRVNFEEAKRGNLVLNDVTEKGKAPNPKTSVERRKKADDFTAAHLCVNLVTDETNLTILQESRNAATFSHSIPMTISLHLDSNGTMQTITAKTCHQYSDGDAVRQLLLRAAKYSHKAASNAQVHRDARLGRFGGAEEKSLFTNKTYSYLRNLQNQESPPAPTVFRTQVPRTAFAKLAETNKGMKERAKLLETNPLASKHDKQLANVDLSPVVAVQIACMALFDSDTSQLAEVQKMTFAKQLRLPSDLPSQKEFAVGLYPVPFGMNKNILQYIRSMHDVRNRIDTVLTGNTKKITSEALFRTTSQALINLQSALSLLNHGRNLTREGNGPTQSFLALLRNKIMQDAVRISTQAYFDPFKSALLRDTLLVSGMVGTKKPLDSGDDFMSVVNFTSAFSEAYNKFVFGAVDAKDPSTGKDIVVITVRTREGYKPTKEEAEALAIFSTQFPQILKNTVELMSLLGKERKIEQTEATSPQNKPDPVIIEAPTAITPTGKPRVEVRRLPGRS